MLQPIIFPELTRYYQQYDLTSFNRKFAIFQRIDGHLFLVTPIWATRVVENLNQFTQEQLIEAGQQLSILRPMSAEIQVKGKPTMHLLQVNPEFIYSIIPDFDDIPNNNKLVLSPIAQTA